MTSKRVLVTGATGGIGQACALGLAADGYHVTLHYRSNGERAKKLVEEIEASGGTASTICFDVTDRAATNDALTTEVETNGAFYGVICNAGITADNAFPALTGDDWDRVIHTNLDAFYNVLNPLTMPMIRLRKGGRIITLSSVSGIMGNRGQVNYSAAKAGIIGATKALALELAKRNITVNCVAPGFIQTDMTEGLIVDEALKLIPMQRVGTPADVAGTVRFLMSDAAAYITRQVIQVNGGMI
jgi:3-oxoacyl-(acyl-carrier-protein) reductase, putative